MEKKQKHINEQEKEKPQTVSFLVAWFIQNRRICHGYVWRDEHLR